MIQATSKTILHTGLQAPNHRHTETTCRVCGKTANRLICSIEQGEIDAVLLCDACSKHVMRRQSNEGSHARANNQKMIQKPQTPMHNLQRFPLKPTPLGS